MRSQSDICALLVYINGTVDGTAMFCVNVTTFVSVYYLQLTICQF
jgi:hypothetical protein